MKKLRSRLQSGFKKIVQIEDNPQSIAKGFALGSFIGMMPIPGFQMLVSLGIATLFRINKKSACIAVFNTNIVTGAFVFAFNYWLGKKLLGIQSNYQLPEKIGLSFIQNIFSAGLDVFTALTVGGIITGTIAALAAYQGIKVYLNNHKNV